ncbi:uncharacterized protein LOC134658611 [Cydia amplana]|uniref:uncharacterized protein LOC134658611 n=1 Tax=Cydia amplana TaxID=1869771 RepID=UPI002FE518E9
MENLLENLSNGPSQGLNTNGSSQSLPEPVNRIEAERVLLGNKPGERAPYKGRFDLPDIESESEEEESVLPEERPSASKRARKPQAGDPEPDSGPKKVALSNTKTPVGHYSGMAKARSLLRADIDTDFVADLEAAVTSGRRSARLQYKKASQPNRDRSPIMDGLENVREDVVKIVRQATQTVSEEVKKSSNISGRVVGKINTALKDIANAMNGLANREEGDELRALRADNKRMREQLALLQEETKALRRAFSERNEGRKKPPQTEANSVHALAIKESLAELKEELKNELIKTVGDIINIRLDEVKRRLPPEPILRPPLAADREGARDATQIQSLPTAHVRDSKDRPVPKPRKQKPTRADPAMGTQPKAVNVASAPRPKRLQTAPPTPSTQPTRLSQDASQEETWSQVTHKKKKAKKAVKAVTSAPQPATKPAPKPRKRGVVVPPMAAIVVALKPESEATYASILTKATTSFRLTEFGIDHVRIRKTADGARIIEVPNADNGRAADNLREKLETLVGEDAKVYRPVKMAGLRVSCLNESATPDAVAAVIAAKGGCSVEEVKVGAIRASFNGSGSTLVKCPVAAAKKVADDGRISVGWSNAVVQVLDPTPFRCYKCMGTGHTRTTCPSSVERGNLCFRCSKPGHKMAECMEQAFCAACHQAKRPAGHVMGGQACNPPKTRGRQDPVRAPGRNLTADQADEGRNNMEE